MLLARPRAVASRSLLGAALLAAGLTALAACGGSGQAGGRPQALGRLAIGRLRPGVEPSPQAQVLARDNGHGGMALYRVLSEQPGNVVFSPWAVQAAMGMMYLGAQDATAAEIRQAMGWSQEPSDWGPAWDNLASVVATGASASDELELATGSRLFLAQGARVVPSYQQLLTDTFAADSVQLDFAGDADGSRQTINAWVEDQTAGRIQGLLPAGTIDPATSLVQTAALRLKARWQHRMVQASARSLEFIDEAGEAHPLAPLELRAQLPYQANSEFQAAVLPYAGSSLAMVLIRPAGGLGTVEATLDGNRLAALWEEMEPRRLSVSLPPFDFPHQAELSEALARLGLVDAGTTAAHFQILENVPLAIAGIFEQAHIAVDENGTEAEAAAAVIGEATSAPLPDTSEPIAFVLDRPFLFLIVDQAAKAILFIGRFSTP